MTLTLKELTHNTNSTPTYVKSPERGKL